ncbi:nucleoside-diphosphate sugar epimerase/dehydratase [Isoptericola sp. b490]|uniref:nucleoside-diphosphate sugar epimerase/dehydratase n=1 Tax=Actinotalea lenta TaxID=3064654 RepID=UPI002713E113|nr:nucleoside-diphosphate sugar epimerase/dehydratase [Isoptericola sp. b490]MDO8119927.1 nucleoside-diphosphate sugar epimerase/dehydratase [Isoptericola sp. b490]
MDIQQLKNSSTVRRWAWAVIDSTIWVCAIYAAMWLRLDLEAEPVLVTSTFIFAIGAVVLHLVAGWTFGPYRKGHQRGSFEETAFVAQAVVITSAVLFGWAVLASSHLVPRSVPLIAGALTMAGVLAARFLFRSWRLLNSGRRATDKKVIVFGAGEAGRGLLRSMARDLGSGFQAVALLDDDPRKQRLRIEGVPVLGTRHGIAQVATDTGATALVVALPQAESSLIRELSDRAAAAGLDVLILPPLREIIGGRPTSRDLRDVNVEDLLGRRPIKLDTTAIAEQIAGRSILVTGAGGSIGSELCRQIARFRPGKLYMLDRDESGLLATQMSITGEGLLQGDEVVLADIRDPEAMHDVFAATRPDVVFHAAALKHLPLLESFPLEGWKTNVLGTLNVLTAAAEVGVGAFVNVSTDKAADPTCVLGYSKRVAERLTADFAENYPGRYVSVRFGNVLGSRGSVVHTFLAQIQRGGPITITHPDVRRYFMLIPEACQLVLEAGTIGADGEVMVLEMGEQVRIVDVANTLIRMSGRRDIDITFTGLRPGEKVCEDLFSTKEDRRPTANELINSVDVPRINADEVRTLRLPNHADALAWMHGAGVAADQAGV